MMEDMKPYLKKDTKFEKDYDRIVKEVQERIFVELKRKQQNDCGTSYYAHFQKNCMEIGFV